MAALLYAGLNNAVWSAVLALAAVIGARVWRSRPAVGHALWLIVLFKLLTPSLWQIKLPAAPVPARDIKASVEPRQSHTPGRLARPSLDLVPVVSETVAQHDEHPVAVPRARSVPMQRGTSTAGGRTLVRAVGDARRDGRSRCRWSLAGGCDSLVVGGRPLVRRFRRLIRSARHAPAELTERLRQVASRLGLRSVPAAYLIRSTRAALGLGPARG